MYLDDLPLVFVSRLEVAPRFHSAEGARHSTTSTSSKVINLKFAATLFLSVAATYLLSNESILLTKLFFLGCRLNLKNTAFSREDLVLVVVQRN